MYGQRPPKKPKSIGIPPTKLQILQTNLVFERIQRQIQLEEALAEARRAEHGQRIIKIKEKLYPNWRKKPKEDQSNT